MTTRHATTAAFSVLLTAALSCAATASSADGYRIAGTVLDEAGEPLAGAVVAIEPKPDSHAGAVRQRSLLAGGPDPFADFPTATADATGRFELVIWGSEAEKLSRNGCHFQLRLSSGGRLPVAHSLALLVRSRHSPCERPEPADPGARFDPRDANRVTLPPVRLPTARGVAVRVLGPGGEPASGAWVRSFEEPPEGADTDVGAGWLAAPTTARADEDGMARLPMARGTTRVSAYDPEAAPAAAGMAETQTSVELRLESADRQRLRVLSPDGPPLSDAGICLRPGTWCAAYTDVDGLTTLFRAAGPTAVVIHAHDGSWDAELPARTFRGDELAEIDLGAPRPSFDPNAGPSLAGRVASEDGTPVKHAEVYRLDGHHTTSNGRPSVVRDAMVRTGPDGFFQIGTGSTGDGAGNERQGAEREEDGTSLEIWADGHLTERLEGLDANVATGGAMIGPEIGITLRRATTLEGVVRSASGEPLAGAALAVYDPVSSFSMSYPRTLSDADGTFALGRIDPEHGGLVLFASREGHVTRRVPWHELPEPPQPAEVVLQPALTLSGRVVDPEGAGVAAAKIGIARGARPLAEDLYFSAESSADGRFELEGLSPGSWDVTVNHPKFERAVLLVDMEADRDVDLRVEPAASYDVEGRLVGVGGLASDKTGVELALSLADGSFGRSVPFATTDAAGVFRFEDVRPGRYEIELIDDPRVVAAEDKSVEVKGPVRLEVRLEQGATITGRILGLEPTWLERLSLAGPGRGRVDVESATYRLEGVPAGPATVTATVDPLSTRAQGRVVIEPGDIAVTLDLDFDAGLELSGEVVRDGEPLTGVLVRVQRAGTNVAYLPDALTDEAGRFSFRGIPAGEYRVDVHRPGFEGLLASRRLLLEEDRDVVFEVAPSVDFAGVVIDDESGEPLAGVRVVVTREPSRHISLLVGADRAVFTRGDGRFRFTGLPSSIGSDAWHLVAGRDGLATTSRVLPTDGDDDLEIRLESSYDLELTFRSAGGEVPPGATAQVFDDQGNRQAFHLLEPGAGGRALLEDLPAGNWRLLVGADDLVALVDFEIPGPDLDLVGQPGADLDVWIPELSETVREAEVELYDALGRRLVGYPRRTEDGSLLLKNRPAGLFTLRARSGERSWSRQVHLVPGDAVEVIFD